MTIKDFMKEYNFSYNCIKYLYQDAKLSYNLNNYNLIIFKDEGNYKGIRLIFQIDFSNNKVYLINENYTAKYGFKNLNIL